MQHMFRLFVANLVSMLLAAAREIGAETIAEGIETEEEAEVCTRMGFNFAQGYLYSEPISLAEAKQLVADTTSGPL